MSADDTIPTTMLTTTQIETLVREIQIKEKLESPRQVFEKRQDLSAMYIAAVIKQMSGMSDEELFNDLKRPWVPTTTEEEKVEE